MFFRMLHMCICYIIVYVQRQIPFNKQIYSAVLNGQKHSVGITQNRYKLVITHTLGAAVVLSPFPYSFLWTTDPRTACADPFSIVPSSLIAIHVSNKKFSSKIKRFVFMLHNQPTLLNVNIGKLFLGKAPCYHYKKSCYINRTPSELLPGVCVYYYRNAGNV